jgi:hypothetical protein
MYRLLALVAVAGCASAPPPRPLPPDAPHINIQINGSRADDGKIQRCNSEINQAGKINDPSLPVTVTLTLEGNYNKIQVISRARGIVRNEDLPGWDMGRLCREAISSFAPAMAQEPPPGAIPPPPPPRAYPPAYGYGYPPPNRYPSPQPAPRVYVPPPPRPTGPPALMAAPAGIPADASNLVATGTAFYQRGDYANAVASFVEAQRRAPSPPLLFDCAAAFKMAGKNREAAQHLQLYLDRAPNAPNRAQAEALLQEVRRALGEED